MIFVRFAGAFAALLLASGIASAQSPRPTDPQIAHIAYTAGQLDIAAAQLALQKSKNKDVVAFATDLERDHKAVNEQALALVKKLNVTPEDNDTSKALTKQAAEKRAELAKLSGAAFDKAYIDNEVAYHKTVNGALQSTLIPSAANAELKDLLTTGLKIFQGHEQHAEHVAAEFKKGRASCIEEHRGARSARSFSSLRRGPHAPTLFKSRWKNWALCRQKSRPMSATRSNGSMPITATARDGAWDVLIPVKTTKSIVLKAEGVGDYYCKFHPNMTGRVSVTK